MHRDEPTLRVRRGASTASDTAQAAREVFAGIEQPETKLVLFYGSPLHDREVLAELLARRFEGATIVGCTTAGEIGELGYRDGTLVGVSFAGVDVASVRIDDLERFELADGEAAAARALDMLEGARPSGVDTFGFMLVDGLAMQEEALVASFQKALGDIALVGGSAADGLEFARTYIYHDGAFRTQCAVLCLVRTDVCFEVFKTEHFVPSQTKMVVTEADPARRIVTEINGAPAAREYARVVGLELEALTPFVFASHPVVVRVAGVTYVRSIQRVNEDESLTFFCAIDEGIVLTVGTCTDLVESLRSVFESVEARIGTPLLVLGWDCVLRNIEAKRTGVRDAIGEIMQEHNVLGFSTYGEQFNGMHVNQTFAGVAVGTTRRRSAELVG